jgi:hypothetical protein
LTTTTETNADKHRWCQKSSGVLFLMLPTDSPTRAVLTQKFSTRVANLLLGYRLWVFDVDVQFANQIGMDSGRRRPPGPTRRCRLPPRRLLPAQRPRPLPNINGKQMTNQGQFLAAVRDNFFRLPLAPTSALSRPSILRSLYSGSACQLPK